MTSRPLNKWIPLLAVAALIAVNWTGFKGSFYGFLPAISPDRLPAWRTDYKAALAEARASGKPILVDFTADWCPPCRVMEREVWPDERLRQALKDNAIPLKLDVDVESTNTLVQSRRIRSIPTVLLLDAEGNEVARRSMSTAGQLLRLLQDHTP